jgi:CheY-like chemotaxis protein
MKVLAVDDEALNLTILEDVLIDEGFEVITANHGRDALEKLKSHKDIELILLDRMMPEMDGMTAFHNIRENPSFAHIPVIMQTAMADKESVIDGIEAGVFHYLTKPYRREMLTAVIRSALADIRRNSKFMAELTTIKKTFSNIQSLELTLKTFAEGQRTAHLLAQCYPHPERTVIGLLELIYNAIEHGNLSIHGEEKIRLLKNGTLRNERERLLSLPQNAQKLVSIYFERQEHSIIVRIRDEGRGFNWQSYLSRNNPNISSGIQLAQTVSFDQLHYNQIGNEVTAIQHVI